MSLQYATPAQLEAIAALARKHRNKADANHAVRLPDNPGRGSDAPLTWGFAGHKYEIDPDGVVCEEKWEKVEL